MITGKSAIKREGDMPSDDVGESDRKRVRFDSDEKNQSPDQTATTNGQTSRPHLQARDVVELRFVGTATDFKSGGASAPHPQELTSKAPFLHQIIPNERVYGCQHATVAVYIHNSTLSYWIETDVEPYSPRKSHSTAGPDNQDETHATDVQALLTPFIKSGLTFSRAQFLNAVNAPVQFPLKNLVYSYWRNDESFAVYKEKLFEYDASGTLIKREQFHDFHRRMAFLMFVHIDGASFIDDEDPRWEIFVIVRTENNRPTSFVGYATVYPFAALCREEGAPMSFLDRIRISQVAISPLFQRQRHGVCLLDAIYSDAHKRNAMQITVEDPSKSFRILRDITDLRWTYRANVLSQSEKFAYDDEESLKKVLRTKLLLTESQSRRCLEVHQLRFINRAKDEDAYKHYRLWVKRRLFIENTEELSQYDASEKKEKLAQLYEGYESEFTVAARRIDEPNHPRLQNL